MRTIRGHGGGSSCGEPRQRHATRRATPIHVLLVPDELTYTGRELASHFAYRRFDLLGDSCVAFIGPCRVETEALIDLADSKRSERIVSERMLHFIVEHFDGLDIGRAVLRQRLFASIVREALEARGVQGIVRRGDDLFAGDAKLSVSIATASPVSTLIHFGINVSSRGTPVKTLGLEDARVDPRDLARAVLDAYRSEMASIDEARTKVRAVP